MERPAMQACAYVVGPDDGPGAALSDMAREYGFPLVLPYAGAGAAEAQSHQTPLMFFLFAAVDGVMSLKRVADGIRFSASRRVRFSPLVYFSESPSMEAIRRCIDMGFDDVITLPFTPRRVLDRLERLVDRPQVYHETPGYLGPERPGTVEPAGGQYRRIEIVRSAGNGVSVLRDEIRVAI